MVRAFACLVAALAFLLGSWVPAEDKPSPERRTAADKAGKPLQFDLDQLFQDHDKNKDGFLDRNEVPPLLRAHFDQLDTNKDGKLSREEIQRGMVLLQPSRRPSDVALVLIEMSDCDACCIEELQRLYDVLRKLDPNQSGKLDPGALTTAREQIFSERVDRIFKELDTDKDGRISRAEAKGQIRRHFDEIDTNKDGFIDRNELLQAAREHPLGKPGGKSPARDAAKSPGQPDRR